MIQGIEVLAEEYISVVAIQLFGIFSLVIGAMLAITFFALLCTDKEDYAVSISFIVVGLVIAIIGAMMRCDNPESYTQYKVTISDSVSFNEFNSRYEVLSQEGQIFTIKEKENKDED